MSYLKLYIDYINIIGKFITNKQIFKLNINRAEINEFVYRWNVSTIFHFLLNKEPSKQRFMGRKNLFRFSVLK